ncbi:MAG: hypothetical protein NC324_08215 [Bacteroides sp.]|nr:hypothetical protein [Bacteroides sp.]
MISKTLRLISGLSAAALLLTAASCNRKDNISVPPVPVLRYDLALMQLEPDNLKEGLQGLTDSFPLYLEGADWDNPLNLQRIQNFVEDPVVQQAYGKIRAQYPDSKALGTELTRIFERTRQLFPAFQNPEVYTYISYFDFVNRVLYLDSMLSIALDLYIDGNQERLDEIGVPRYMSRKLDAAHLGADVARVIGSALIKQEKETLLDHLVYEGKVLYFMQDVLPDASPETLFGYSREQVLWCKAHEREVWQYMVQQNLLYESNPLKFRYFVNEGPFNPLLEGAPARLSQFVGLRIVRAYLKKSSKDFNALLNASAQEVLQGSAYRP